LSRNRGFSLIEALVAACILLCGLLAAASLFSFAVRANISNRQMTVATTLLYDKMEQFREASLTDPVWTAGDGSDSVTIDGTYVRVWRISTGPPLWSVTVIVYAESSPLTHRQTELIRATSLASPSF